MDIDRYIERMDEIFEEKKEEERFEDVNWIILIISLMMLGCLLRLNKERLVYLVGFLIFESYLCYIVGLYKRDSKLIVVCVLMILVELDLLNRAYVWMVLYLIVKMWYLRNNNKKIKTIVVISWLITVMQYQRISFE